MGDIWVILPVSEPFRALGGCRFGLNKCETQHEIASQGRMLGLVSRTNLRGLRFYVWSVGLTFHMTSNPLPGDEASLSLL